MKSKFFILTVGCFFLSSVLAFGQQEKEKFFTALELIPKLEGEWNGRILAFTPEYEPDATPHMEIRFEKSSLHELTVKVKRPDGTLESAGTVKVFPDAPNKIQMDSFGSDGKVSDVAVGKQSKDRFVIHMDINEEGVSMDWVFMTDDSFNVTYFEMQLYTGDGEKRKLVSRAEFGKPAKTSMLPRNFDSSLKQLAEQIAMNSTTQPLSQIDDEASTRTIQDPIDRNASEAPASISFRKANGG